MQKETTNKRSSVPSGAVKRPPIHDVVFSAIKSYPYFWSSVHTVKCLINKPRKRVIIDGGKGRKAVFSFNGGAGYTQRYSVTGRKSAFSIAMHFFIKMCSIKEAQVVLMESSTVNAFAVFVNRFALIKCQYRFSDSTNDALTEIEQQIRDGCAPSTPSEISACKYADYCKTKLEQTPIPNSIQRIEPSSMMPHLERIKLGIPKVKVPGPPNKTGRYYEPKKPNDNLKIPAPKIYPGRSRPADPPKERPAEPWLVNKWADRYDHDD